jgi:hypothetical protein
MSVLVPKRSASDEFRESSKIDPRDHLRPVNENGQQGARHHPSNGSFARFGDETNRRRRILKIRWPIDSEAGKQAADAKLDLRSSILPPTLAAVNYPLLMVRWPPRQLFPVPAGIPEKALLSHTA